MRKFSDNLDYYGLEERLVLLEGKYGGTCQKATGKCTNLTCKPSVHARKRFGEQIQINYCPNEPETWCTYSSFRDRSCCCYR